ncbi:MAG: hypothetical protein NW205_04710 [Hyphomicrobiaceae bacterium]|nr:hypothetical protein [Hyphomicrobiaceae bacterium]
MIVIVLTACLIQSPGVCRDVRLPYVHAIPLDMCAMNAPPYFAGWAADHPEWQVKSWRCTAGGDSDG